MSSNTNNRLGSPKTTVQPRYGPVHPKADEHLMVFAWQFGRYDGKAINDWDAVIKCMREEGWEYSDQHIKYHWYTVVVPAIVKSRVRAARYAERERTNSNKGNNRFESVVDRTFDLENDVEDYDHSLTPYAKGILGKLAEDYEDIPLWQRSAVPEEQEQEPGSGGKLPLLQPSIYVPSDSEKPSTRGYTGLNPKSNINTADAIVGNVKEANTSSNAMPNIDAHTSNAVVADHDTKASSSDEATSYYENHSETSSFLDMTSEDINIFASKLEHRRRITADATTLNAKQAAEKIDFHHGYHSESDVATDHGKRVIKAKADKVFIKHNKASEERPFSKFTANLFSDLTTSDPRSCAAGVSQQAAITMRAGAMATGPRTTDSDDSNGNDALPAGKLCPSMDDEYDPKDEASASEFS